MALLRTRGIIGVVTDRKRLSPGRPSDVQSRAVVRQAVAAASAQADFIQIREGDLEARELSALVREVLQSVAGSPLRVLINDRLDVALSEGAHGIHLPGRGIQPGSVRQIAPRSFLIGQSIHGTETPGAGADLAIFGTVFSSPSKNPGHATAGVAGLSAAARLSAVPVLAIGGITEGTVERVSPFCAGVAAIGWFATTDAPRMVAAVRAARLAFDTISPLI